MEQVFGADFSGVKVHTDADADVLNQSLQARAFTTGKDIFFRSGEYRPDDTSGQRLLAHELTHVVQQRAATTIQKADGEEAETTESVSYSVPLIPQPTSDSCWAAAMAMVVSYHEGRTVPPEEIAASAGIDLNMSYDWDVLYAAAMNYGLREIPPASYTPGGWAGLLTDHGPLWVIETGAPSHAVVLTGITDHTVQINNPWPPGTGNMGPRTFEDFALSFGGAAEAVGENMQILYYGG
jgi:hypothetical protein